MKNFFFSILLLNVLLISRMNGQSWAELSGGVNSNVYSLAADPNQNVLYAGGRFTQAGSLPVNRIAQWDGTNWADVGGGFNNDVYALYFFNGDLYAGGAFTLAGGNPANHIAKWDGTSWSAVGNGFDNDVYKIFSFNNQVVAGGIFINADTIPVNRIATWDGTAWNAFGSGIGLNPTDYVEGLMVYQNELYAGGIFSQAGGINTSGIARWNGTAWDSLAGGVSGLSANVADMAVYMGELVVGGQFTNADTLNAVGIAKWNGSSWSEMSGGGVLGGQNNVRKLEILFNILYVGGNFSSAGGVNSPFISSYNGTTWSSLNSGLNNEVDALAGYDGKLIAGGEFDFADTIVLSNIGQWTPLCAISTSVSATTTLCIGTCDGSASVVASGNGSLTYSWSTNPPQSSDTATGLCAGIYYVIVSDTTGCSVTDSIVVADPPSIGILFSTTGPSCTGQCNASVQVQASGRPPFSYQWSTGDSTDVVSNLCPGVYTITVTDSAGCVHADSVAVMDPAPNSISLSSTMPSCFGSCNGTLTAVSTGTAPFIYQWSNGDSLQTATGLCSGVYSVNVIDSLGCTALDFFFLTAPAPNIATAASTSPTCHAGCDGSAFVSSTGVSPFTYVWSNADTNQTASALCAGQYLVTVTDSLGCMAVDTVDVIDPASAILTFTPNAAICLQVCNGSASVSSSSVAPFSYLWSNGDTAQLTSNLCAGTVYSVTVTDSLGCSTTDTITMTSQPAATISIFSSSPSCNAVCNGTLLAIISTVPPYSYQWSNGETDPNIDSLCSGIFSVTITDGLGCIVSDSLNLAVAASPVISFSTQPTNCNGGCIGQANVSVSPPMPVTYLWSTTDTTQAIANLCFGNYFITITDTSGCVYNDSVLIAAQGTFPVTISPQNPSCSGSCNGLISLATLGGTSPYSYSWSNDSTLNAAVDSFLCAGSYTFIITDSVGCSSSDSVTITAPAPVTVLLNHTDALCFGDCNGTATANGSGIGQLSYSWQTIPPQSTNVATGLCFGYAAVIVTDSTGCSVSDSILIFQPDPILPHAFGTDATCFGQCDGFATSNPMGGTPLYSYIWSGSQTTPTILNLCPGVYTVTVTDANGCTAIDSAFVSTPAPLQLALSHTDATCTGCNDGTATAVISGGTTPYNFIWTPGNNTTDTVLTGLSPGFYTFCVTDNNNCVVICDSVIVTEPNGIADHGTPVAAIKIFPNPAKGKFTVELSNHNFSEHSKLVIMDMMGKKIFETDMPQRSMSFDIAELGLMPGVYFIMTKEKSRVTGTGKIVITH